MLKANRAERTLSGLVLPFNEEGRTNHGKVKAHKGTLKLAPIVTMNTQHDGVNVGLAASMTEEDDGWHGVFNIAEGPEGDKLLAEYEADERRGLSVEIPDVVTRAGDVIAGTISSVAAVVKGAFPSALMAADAGDLPEDLPDWYQPSESTNTSTEEMVIDGVTYVRKSTNVSTTTVTRKDGEPKPEENEEMTTDAPPQIDAGLLAAFAAAVRNGKPEEKTKGITPRQAFKAIANGKKTNTLEAALVNIVHDDGDNDGDGLGEIASAPGWLGEVYNEAAYVRRYIPLLTQGTLTSYRELGFRWSTKPTVAPYTGNKTAVPSTGMTAEPVPYGTKRWANAADLDRRFVDFGDQDVVQAFIEANIESYREVTDIDALALTIAAATPVETGAAVPDINPALTRIVDGVLALIANNKRPTSAVVGMADFRSLLLTPKDQIAEFLSQSMGVESGSVLGFQIVPSSNEDVQDGALVIDKATVRYKEFGGGSPVRVEAEHIADGGKDLGIFGYTSHQVLSEEGIVLVKDAVAP